MNSQFVMHGQKNIKLSMAGVDTRVLKEGYGSRGLGETVEW